jgi:hypothetical protein
MTRFRYRPHFSFLPIVPVRWRSAPHYHPRAARLSWRLYLFGLLPLMHLPRRK